MASVMNTHRFEDIRYEFVPGGEVVPYLRHMNHAGYSVVPKAQCTLTYMRRMPRSRPRQDTCTAAPQPVFMLTAMLATTFISMDRRWTPIPQMTIQSDRAGGPRTGALLARMLQFGGINVPDREFFVSVGLEIAIQKGIVVDTATLAAYARTAVEQAARGDGIALIAAHNAATADDFDTLVQIDNIVFARKLSEETRTMTVRMGKKFTEIGLQVIDLPFLRRWCG